MLAEIGDGEVRDEIDHIQPLLAPPKDARIRQRLEMPGYVGLGQPGGFDELGNIPLPLLQGAQQLETACLTQHPESGGDELQRLVRHGGRFNLAWHKLQNSFL